jgi:hypothetical protein
MPHLGDAMSDSANFDQPIDFGAQNVTTTGTITAGAMVIPRPYGCFSHAATITLTGGTTADAIAFDTDEVKNHITHSTSVNNSRITVDQAGVYSIIFSVIAKGGTNNKLFNIWLAVEGSPITRTNTIQNLSTSGVERIITVEFFYTFTAGQYFQIMAWSDATNTTLVATAAQATPTRPACPSIILTVKKVSS